MEEKYFRCEIHKQNFLTVEALKQHVIQDHPKEPATCQLKCEVCNKRFKSKLQFEIHSRRHPPNDTKERTSQNSPAQLCKKLSSSIHTEGIQENAATAVTMKMKAEDNSSFQCHMCSDFFLGEINLRQHLISHTENLRHRTTEFDSLDLEEDVKPMPNVDDEEVSGIDQTYFSCGTCEETFLLKTALNDHLRIHIKQEPQLTFSDDPDGRSQETRFARQQPISNERSDQENSSEEDCWDYETKVSCLEDVDDVDYNPEDDPDFVNSASLPNENVVKSGKNSNTVQQDVILNEKCNETTSKNAKNENRCYFCNEKYQYPKDLLRHIRIHTMEKPFVCQDQKCKQSFKDQRILDRHNYKNHGIPIPKLRLDNLERCVRCSRCELSFYTKQALHQHMIIHGIKSATSSKPYGCSICPNFFKDRSTLKKHKLSHSEVRAHVCLQCQKAFKRSEGLRKHQVIHSKERPFKCKFCLKDYNRKDTYKQHMKTFHLQDEVNSV